MLAMHTLSVRDALDYTLTAAPLLGAILAVPTLAAAAGHEPLPPWPTLPLEPRTLREHLVRSRAHLDAGSSAAHAHAPRAHAPHARGEPAESNRTRRPTQISHTPPVNLPSTSDKPPTNLPQTSQASGTRASATPSFTSTPPTATRTFGRSSSSGGYRGRGSAALAIC